MSEQKRINLQSLTTMVASSMDSVGGSPTAAAARFNYISESKGVPGYSSDDGRRDKTVRLKLKLFQTDSSNYPEFNYSKLVNLEKKKDKKSKPKSNGLNEPFDTNDDDVARLAKELEKKYGTGNSNGRSRNRKDDHCDIGLGYDESDSFIDNTEAYDEIIPEEVEPIEGGFYINCGALEFKKLYNEPFRTKTDEIIKMPNRPRKRILSSSSDDASSGDVKHETYYGDGDNKERTNEISDSSDAEGVAKSQMPYADKLHKSSKKQTKSSLEADEKNKKTITLSCSSSNSPKPSATENGGSDSEKDRMRQKSVKTTTVKDMLKAKRDSYLKMQEEADSKHVNGELKGVAIISSGDDSSSDEFSDNIGDNSDSNESEQVQRKEKTKKSANHEENTEKLRTSDTALPELDNEIALSVQEFKDIVKAKNIFGKRFQFDDKLTEVFLRIDDSLLCIEKPQRNIVFAHLEYHLLLPKYFLLRKAKQLRVKEEKLKSKRALNKLRKAIIDIMPSIIANYEVELQKTAESQCGNLNLEQPPKMPKKKFLWNGDLRKLLYEVYQVRWTSYPVLGTRKETLEDFINIYMRDNVAELWPNGWMRYEELQREIEKRKSAGKKSKEKAQPTVGTAPLVKGGATCGTVPQMNIATTVDGIQMKPLEGYTSSSRSCTNSDTDSVTSSSNSAALKRKNRDNKQNKPKTKKSNRDMQNQMLGIAGKRTDHSIYNIISETATATAHITTSSSIVTSSATSNNLSAKNALVCAETKHSGMPCLPAHVIDLDKYNINDIIQSSKQMLRTTAGTIEVAAELTSAVTVASPQDNARRSSSESDGVEIVGVFPAEATQPVAIGKQKYKRGASSSQSSHSAVAPVSTNNSINKIKLEPHANFNASSCSSTASSSAVTPAGVNNEPNNSNNSKKPSTAARHKEENAINASNIRSANVLNCLKELEMSQNVETKNRNQ